MRESNDFFSRVSRNSFRKISARITPEISPGIPPGITPVISLVILPETPTRFFPGIPQGKFQQ